MTTDKEVKQYVVKFLAPIISALGMGFHVDTDFNDYVDSDDNPFYDRKEADRLNFIMELVCIICHDRQMDIYGISLDLLQSDLEEEG